MIWESCYWKEPLLKTASWLRRFRMHDGTRESTLVKIEKEIMIGFYAIRKLIEAHKVSDSTTSSHYQISWFPNHEPTCHLNWHKIDVLYDLNQETKESRDLRFLCNRFIHSYVFITDTETDGHLSGIFVASDKDRNQKLYYVSMDTIIKIFRLVGRDYPACGHYQYNPKTGKETINLMTAREANNILNNLRIVKADDPERADEEFWRNAQAAADQG
jgi:hypothetical protein